MGLGRLLDPCRRGHTGLKIDRLCSRIWCEKGATVADDLRDRLTTLFQKNVANRVMRAMPFQTLLETTGRTSGEPRRTPLGGSKVGNEFWFVSEFGENSQYVKNIKVNPNVRVRLRGRWPHRHRPSGARRRPTGT